MYADLFNALSIVHAEFASLLPPCYIVRARLYNVLASIAKPTPHSAAIFEIVVRKYKDIENRERIKEIG